MAKPSRDDIPAETIIAGRYQVQSLLGRGGMAAVYRAIDLVLQREVALKVMRRSVTTEERVVQRFLREARRMAALDSAHVVPVYDAGQDGLHVFLVMKLLTGSTLEDILQVQKTITPERAAELVGQLLEGLGYLHARGLVHRDIKPSNLMVVEENRAVLLDLGIARSAPAENGHHGREVVRHHTTEEQMLLGTPEYMSPERVLDQAVDGRSDLYSVGILLYEALTGQMPFEGKTPIEVCMRQLNEAPMPPRQAAPDLSEGFEQVILRALEKDPNARFQTADEMRRALLEALFESPVPSEARAISLWHGEPEVIEPGAETTHVEALERWTPDRERRRRQGKILALVAGTSVAGLALFAFPWLLGTNHPPETATVARSARAGDTTRSTAGSSEASAAGPGSAATASGTVADSSAGASPNASAAAPGAPGATTIQAGNAGSPSIQNGTSGSTSSQNGAPGSTSGQNGASGSTSGQNGASGSTSGQNGSGLATASHGAAGLSGTGASTPVKSGGTTAGRNGSSAGRTTSTPAHTGASSSPVRATESATRASSPGSPGGSGASSPRDGGSRSGTGDVAGEARSRLAAGDTAGALTLLEDAISQSPDRADLFRLKGDTYYRIGNRGAAIAAYRRCLNLSPGASDAAAAQRRLEELGGLSSGARP